MTWPVVAFCGMTHLGLNSAVAAAEKGTKVICFDPDRGRIERLDRLRMPVAEPGLAALAKRNRSRLTFTDEPAALASADVVYAAPDIGTDDDSASDLGGIRALLDLVGPAVRPEAALVVLSQVPPGFTRSCGHAHGALYYQVETLIFGRAIERALAPERHIVGAADPAAPLPDAYRAFLELDDCPLLVMRYESAELAKIAINCCLVSSIAAANMLAELSERVGADWHEIVPALRLDHRIGPGAYLDPGLGIAGGNLERDLATVIGLGRALDAETGVAQAWIADSRYRRDWALRQVEDAGLAAGRVAVWGLAYKKDTHSAKNSPALATLSGLPRATVRAHDPAVPADALAGFTLTRLGDRLACLDGADALLILTPWDEYRETSPGEVAERLAGTLVVDPYRVLDGDACRAAGLDWRTLGVALERVGGVDAGA